jgi:high-affinity iron transporter
MLGQYLITFREVLEAALIISIILAYLRMSGKHSLSRYVWLGAAGATSISIIMGILIWIMYGELSESSMKLFEGVAALIAVGVLTSMILWMAIKSEDIQNEIEVKVDTAINEGTKLSVFSLSFILVFREGFETVLFLIPFSTDDPSGTLVGATFGIISSLIIAFGIFKIGIGFDMKRFFYFSSLLLIFLAAGLAGYGVHELLEYREAVGSNSGWIGSLAFNLDISKGSAFHHKGSIGSVFAVMFGYSVKMEWGRLIVHSLYLIAFLPITMWIYKRMEN